MKSKSSNVSERMMMRAAVRRVDDALAAIRDIAVDITHINRGSKEVAAAIEEAKYALEMSFAIKNAIADAKYYGKIKSAQDEPIRKPPFL